MLLNNYETHKISSNIKTLEAAAWHTIDHVVPVIQTNSCLPLLYSFSEFVHISTDKKVCSYIFSLFEYIINPLKKVLKITPERRTV